jgi:hypothetical protein
MKQIIYPVPLACQRGDVMEHSICSKLYVIVDSCRQYGLIGFHLSRQMSIRTRTRFAPYVMPTMETTTLLTKPLPLLLILLQVVYPHRWVPVWLHRYLYPYYGLLPLAEENRPFLLTSPEYPPTNITNNRTRPCQHPPGALQAKVEALV